ncbi:helix-turn-helix domain-containing protein [Spirosoma flavum]|uniref:Helix-turn-helix domain-containing protein n=1 Tax=Spirosoma flavum TaxID=2048557 RepID=A0ABW6AIW6_9BACT
MEKDFLQRIQTISELHQLFGLPKPEHPLLSVVPIEPFAEPPVGPAKRVVTDVYIISLKKGFRGPVKIKYGQQVYDFDEGVLSFMAPGQVFGLDLEKFSSPTQSGWMLFIHPDFFWNTALARQIRQYEFFGYEVNEALFLSAKEEAILTRLIDHINQEYQANLDKFSQQIILAQIDALLSYSERFYERQFITRRISSHQLLDQVDQLLTAWLADEERLSSGLPTVQAVAEQLQVSPDYLSGLLRQLTGLNTQQHIHQRLLEKAKEKLSTTHLSVSEIAYQLGFEHPQSFSRLFKEKTHQSPLAFRQSFH